MQTRPRMGTARYATAWAIIAALFAASSFTSATCGQCEYEIIRPDAWTPAQFILDGDQCVPRLASSANFIAMTATLYEDPHDQHQQHEGLPSVVVYQHDGMEWVFDQLIEDPERVATVDCEHFGSAIALHDKRLVIADPRGSMIRIRSYDRAPHGWILASTFDIDDELDWFPPDRKRIEMDLSDAGLFVFARLDIKHPGGGGSSIIYDCILHYEDVGGQWRYDSTIAGQQSQSTTAFGSSISCSDQLLAIGDPAVPVGNGRRGRINIYIRDRWFWRPAGVIEAETEDEDGIGARGMTLFGHTLVTLSAAGDNGSGDGHVHVFDLDGQSGEWTRTAQLAVPAIPGIRGTDAGVILGGLDFDGERIAVTRTARGAAASGGTLYIATQVDGVWTMGEGVRPNDRNDNAQTEGYTGTYGRERTSGFGSDVVIWNGTAMVAAVRSLGQVADDAGIPCLLSYALNDSLGADHNSNGICDDRDFISGVWETDLDLNGLDDSWEIDNGRANDCNQNGVIDHVEPDCNGDGVPDDCEDDCNDNGVPDVCESAYDFGPNDRMPEFPVEFFTGQHRMILRPITIQEDAEVITDVTIHRGSVFDDAVIQLMVFQDPTNDQNPDDAQLVHVQPIEFQPGTIYGGVRVPVPNVTLGDAGGIAYIGLASSVRRYNERPFALTPDVGPDAQQLGIWMFVNESEPLDFDDLMSSEVHEFSADFWLAIEAHAGPHGWCCNATDFNEDGTTDAEDLLGLLVAWGPCKHSCPEDVTTDGTVNINDLLILLNNWGPCR